MSETVRPKAKRRGRGCLIALLVIVVILGAAGGIGWWYVEREHREARSVTFANINFSKLHDGTYHGAYAGGIYRWRYNECSVTVAGGKVTDINLDQSTDPSGERGNAEMLYERVIKAQSLQVDTISGSTLTSKGYLKCVENGLAQAVNQ